MLIWPRLQPLGWCYCIKRTKHDILAYYTYAAWLCKASIGAPDQSFKFETFQKITEASAVRGEEWLAPLERVYDTLTSEANRHLGDCVRFMIVKEDPEAVYFRITKK